ncbi:Hypothetical predicted protein [Olea europaea subsp. europaea]|uniref:Uncharacterized protein n=1 Tax=Olea europaea subsp. europaea TaxID=158383 RepID=A0A8S0TGQ1_OLEEU|nr:Hypothetical predicted protein [Olea europaea subsp. europaea]
MEDNGTGRPNRIQLWKNTHYKDNKVGDDRHANHTRGTCRGRGKGLGRGLKFPHATSRANTIQRENAELHQVVHNLQSQNERTLALLEEIMPGATAGIVSS